MQSHGSNGTDTVTSIVTILVLSPSLFHTKTCLHPLNIPVLSKPHEETTSDTALFKLVHKLRGADAAIVNYSPS